jgi:hypothetical protein
MNILPLEHNGFRVLATPHELEAMRQILNEAKNPYVVREFEKRVGTSRERALELFYEISSLRPTKDHELQNQFSVGGAAAYVSFEISFESLNILRNCTYEICNSIRLFEFELRIGIELEDALAILKMMTKALNR